MSIEIFRKIINLTYPKINVEIKNKYGGGIVTLHETDSNAILKTVTIAGLDINYSFAFNIDIPNDKNYVLSSFLNDKKKYGLRKVCDGVIFNFVENELVVYLCELKSTNPTGYVNKFRSSEAFIFYLEKIAKEFFDFNKRIIIKRLLFDIKTGKSKTLTKGNKIPPTKIGYDKNGKQQFIKIYIIHHLKESESLNIRHLE